MAPPTTAATTAATMYWPVGADFGVDHNVSDPLLLWPEDTDLDLFEEGDGLASKRARWLPLDISSDDEAALFADLLEL